MTPGQATLRIYGSLTDKRKEQLRLRILSLFGGQNMTEALCDKINEYASKWYKKVVLHKQTRVINSKRSKK